MPARRYVAGEHTVSKVSVSEGDVHVVEEGNFWKGNRSWEHVAVCGASITGTPVSLMKLTCPGCRRVVESWRAASTSKPKLDGGSIRGPGVVK